MEICWFIKDKTVTMTEDGSREPTIKSNTTCSYNRCETTFYKSLTSLKVFTCNRHLCLLCQFPHCRNVNSSVRSTHNKRSSLRKCGISIAHRRSYMLAVIIFHGFL